MSKNFNFARVFALTKTARFNYIRKQPKNNPKTTQSESEMLILAK